MTATDAPLPVAPRYPFAAASQARVAFEVDGVAVVGSGLAPALIDEIRGEFSDEDGRPGRRSFALPKALAELVAPDGPLGRIAAMLMGAVSTPVRVLKFDKKAGANWAVPWHQDRTIAVAERADIDGFEVWSRKGGVEHVEPPEAYLRDMVALRLHVDDCGVDNGPLEVAAGTWKLGRIASSAVAGTVTRHAVMTCLAGAGDVVAMRGLTLHASQPARKVGHRRVLHVDYATRPLPAPLRFAMS